MPSGVEAQLLRMLGDDLDVPNPQSRVEQLLELIYESGGMTGGGVGQCYCNTNIIKKLC